MTFKNHACCGHTFAPIDGALELQRKLGVDGRRDRARRASQPTGPRWRWRATSNPSTPAEARFSLKYVVATALMHGSVRLEAFEPERLADPATRALMQRIELAVDPEIDARFPGRARRARRRSRPRMAGAAEHFQPDPQGRSGSAADRPGAGGQVRGAGRAGDRQGQARRHCWSGCGRSSGRTTVCLNVIEATCDI